MKMKRLASTLILAAFAILLTSCGKVDMQKTRANYNAMKYTILIRVSISGVFTTDPIIRVRANDFTFDPAKKEIFIKEGFITSNYDDSSFAIKVEGAKFSVPHGGEIEIISDYNR